MRVRSDKSFLFKGDNKEEIIKKGEIKDLPDWIEKTDIFNLAKEEGSILVIQSSNDKKKAENNDSLKSAKNATTPADK